MYLFKRDARESGRDYALRVIKDNIIRLELEPGSMVSEKELALELGLSRGPVREALIELAKVKIVEVYPQRGSAIALIDYDLIEQAGFMRETLETAVVERCCSQGMGPEHLAALQENVKLQRFYLESRNYEKIWELDNEFHSLLFSGAGLIEVYILVSGIFVHFDRVRRMALAAVKEIKFVEDHSLIFEAVAGGDSKTARQQMHQHLIRYQVDKRAIQAQYPQFMR